MRKLVLAGALAAVLSLLVVGGAQATTNCTFTIVGTTMTLNADCTTDASIIVPDGFTLDGAGRTITAVDPPGGHFTGGVVQNGGATANVTNLRVTTSGLADVCDAGAARLRGILFTAASGTIKGNTVTNINQGPSGCQEGNGIEVRGILFQPFDVAQVTSWPYVVTVTGNTVTGYQKTGILSNGDVGLIARDNVIAGPGPVGVPRAASNGIQLGFGATGTVEGNDISGNDYTPKSFVACGLLVFEANGVRADRNSYSGNERNFCNFGRGGGQSQID